MHEKMAREEQQRLHHEQSVQEWNAVARKGDTHCSAADCQVDRLPPPSGPRLGRIWAVSWLCLDRSPPVKNFAS